MNCIIKNSACQSVSSEIFEIFNNFKPKKKDSLLLSASYSRLAEKNLGFRDSFFHRSERVSVCGHHLEFAKNILSSGEVDEASTSLHKALFCRDRLCPLCQWRRSLLVFGQVSDIMTLISEKYKFALLTLTVPSVSADELSETINNLLYDLKKFFQFKDIKSVVCGFYRALEITFNREKKTFHPHFHIVLALPQTYGGREYITRNKWLELWQTATKDETITQVDIRIIKKLHKAVAEVAKYTVKSNQYLFPDDPALTDFCVETLSRSLKNVRLYGFGGCFREAYKKLKLEDVESDNADLLGVRKTKLDKNLPWLIFCYKWIQSDYKLSETRVELPSEHACNMKKSE